MTAINSHTVDQALRNAKPVDYDPYLTGWNALWHGEVTEVETELGTITFRDRTQIGNSEYDEVPIFLVVETEDGRLFQKEGTYSSWDSTYLTYGDCVEVLPIKEVLTYYRHKE